MWNWDAWFVALVTIGPLALLSSICAVVWAWGRWWEHLAGRR